MSFHIESFILNQGLPSMVGSSIGRMLNNLLHHNTLTVAAGEKSTSPSSMSRIKPRGGWLLRIEAEDINPVPGGANIMRPIRKVRNLFLAGMGDSLGALAF